LDLSKIQGMERRRSGAKAPRLRETVDRDSNEIKNPPLTSKLRYNPPVVEQCRALKASRLIKSVMKRR
jgi:hypothetical protein